MTKIIKKYTTSSFPGSFGGLSKFYDEVKSKSTKYSDVKKELLDESAYSLHTPIVKKFKSYRIIVPGINDTWQADLIDVKKFAKENDENKYLLTVIDVFRKKGWAIAIKDKNADTVLIAFKTIFKEAIPKKIHVDEGTEFINSKLKAEKVLIFYYILQNQLTKHASLKGLIELLKKKCIACSITTEIIDI